MRHGFTNLVRKCDGVDSKGNHTKTGKINGYIKDLTKDKIDIAVLPDKPRNQDLNQLATEVWDVISPIININCQYSDFDGKIINVGIDNILKSGYNAWVDAVLKSKIVACNKLYDKYFEGHIIYYIRQLDINTIKNVDDVIDSFKNNNLPDVDVEIYWPDKKEWRTYQRAIQEKDIRDVCQRKTIRALLEIQIDLNSIGNEITQMKHSINNNDQECFKILKGLL